MIRDKQERENADSQTVAKSTPKHHKQKLHKATDEKAGRTPWFYAGGRRGGEAALWIAVIAQAVMDATSRSSNPEARNARNEAIRWLSDGGKDFTEVCLQAGYDPGYIRKHAKRIIATPKRWRAEAGQGKRYLERKAYRERYEKPRCPSPLPKAPAIVIAFAWQQERSS